VGIIGIVAAALIGSIGNVHFDGVLDWHPATEAPVGSSIAKAPPWFFVGEVINDIAVWINKTK